MTRRCYEARPLLIGLAILVALAAANLLYQYLTGALAAPEEDDE